MDWEEKPELNITPLVDIMLVLIALLMLTTPAILYEEKIALAKGSKSATLEREAQTIEIRIDRNRIVYLDKRQYQLAAFPDSFIQYASRFPKRDNKVLIRADKNLRYDDVMYILRTVKGAQFHKVALVTDG